jgi:hypothetical protein
MANLIPIHKTKLKDILSQISWTNNKTFDKLEDEGFKHILKYWTNKPPVYPSIQIIHAGQTTEVFDTAENWETNTYQIRIAQNFDISDFEIIQEETEELVSLITEILANNQNKTNNIWEDLRVEKTGEYSSSSNSTIVFRDIIIQIKNTKTRTPSYV